MLNNKKIILITTPIYYCNSELHLGHLYSSFYADFLSKFYKNEGYKVYFLTGVDQHGQKIFKNAKNKNLNPKEFVDIQTKKILKLWKESDLNFTHFVRTTDEKHKKFVVDLFKELLEKKELILKDYEGKYCIYCENFIFKKNINNKCDVCSFDLINLKEENYFFVFKKEFIEEIKKIIQKYKNDNKEIKYLNQLDKYLEKEQIDFSISRNNIDWGIVLDEKKNQKAYVWFDALLGYVSVFSSKELEEIWKNNNSKIIQVLGKEIIKFHLVYWPILLKKQNLKIPDNFLIHGWILNKESKMSKSLGNVVSASEFLKRYDSDVARLYLAKLMNPQLDVTFNMKNFDEFYNSHIVKNLSNFHFRLLSMVKKFKIDFIDIENNKEEFKKDLLLENKIIENYINNFKKKFKEFKIAKAFDELFKLLDYGNKKITIEEPWNLFKNNKLKKLNFVIYILIVILKIISDLISSFTTKISQKIKKDLSNIKNINDIYEINLKFYDKFTVKLIKHLYEK